MKKPRSFCQTCTKETSQKVLLSVSEAVFHADMKRDHHVIINPDLLDSEEDFQWLNS